MVDKQDLKVYIVSTGQVLLRKKSTVTLQKCFQIQFQNLSTFEKKEVGHHFKFNADLFLVE